MQSRLLLAKPILRRRRFFSTHAFHQRTCSPDTSTSNNIVGSNTPPSSHQTTIVNPQTTTETEATTKIVAKISTQSTNNTTTQNKKKNKTETTMQRFVLEPIGHMETCWKQKQGTPRQSMIIPNARGKLRLTMSSTYEQKHRYKSHLGAKDLPQRANTYHFVEGLEEFSHIWLFWIFHQNFHVQQLSAENNNSGESGEHTTDENVEATTKNNQSLTAASLLNKAKVKPPRLAGKKVGALACRSPYRPNPLGMSVVKLDRIELVEETQETILHLSGVDLVDGTPIIDIKPYIPEYDILQEPAHHVTMPAWMGEMRKQFSIDRVVFLDLALERLEQFQNKSEFYKNGKENLEALKEVISQSIRLDPRSTYRRNKFGPEVFGMCVDVFNVFVSIDDENSVATVLDVEDWSGGIPSKEDLKQKKYTGSLPSMPVVDSAHTTGGQEDAPSS